MNHSDIRTESLEREIDRYFQLARQCLELSNQVDNEAAAERLTALARDYQRKLDELVKRQQAAEARYPPRRTRAARFSHSA